MDLDALREALDVWVQEYVEVLQHQDHLLLEPLEAIVAAARAVLDSEEAWWCERHRAGRRLMLGSPPPEICPLADVAARRLGQNPFDRITCSMVRCRLLAEEKQ